MNEPRPPRILDWINALAIYAAYGFSLGWYHVLTSAGRAGWPLPMFENAGAVLFCTFSPILSNQGVFSLRWLVLVPAVAVLWVAVLTLTAPYFGRGNRGFTWSLWCFGVASAPVALLGPMLAWWSGRTAAGWHWETMRTAAAGGTLTAPNYGLTALYLVLGIVSLSLHLFMYRRVFAMFGGTAARHLVLSALLYLLLLIGLAAVTAHPAIRPWLGFL